MHVESNMLFLRPVCCYRHPCASNDPPQQSYPAPILFKRSTTTCCTSSRKQPTRPQRLFSNVDPQTLQHRPGSVWGASALVAGTTVGAGVLALPAVTLPSGFGASSAALGACWLYAVITGLLVAEVCYPLLAAGAHRCTDAHPVPRSTSTRCARWAAAVLV